MSVCSHYELVKVSGMLAAYNMNGILIHGALCIVSIAVTRSQKYRTHHWGG
jgi:hypothetical protein